MKNLIIATGAFMLLLNVTLNGEENPKTPTNENTYCAEMKGDVLVVIRDGQVLTEDIAFENGTELKTDGRVIYPNGLKATLKAGECVDKTGIIVTPPKNEAKQ
jgi:hypothetical protein